MGINIADGDDVVPVQAGIVTGRTTDPEQAERAELAAGDGKVTNVVSGNARVGLQAGDVVVGDLTIRMDG